MTTGDWAIVAGYVVFVWCIGLWLARRASRSTEEFFASGRKLSWWLAGTSMAASAFSCDTPQYVAGLVVKHGVARNWEWWGFGIGGVVVAFVLAPLWRRVGVLTDLELIELRYGDRSAALLRGFKAIHTGFFINALSIAVPVAAILQLLLALGVPVAEMRGELTAALVLATVLYSYFGGFWGVIVTDVLQFFLALGTSVVVAVLAVRAAGGLDAVVAASRTPTALFDLRTDAADPWTEGILPFLVFACVQWWTYVNADGGGKLVQRMVAARDERHATWGMLWFNVTHYALRTWPWVLVALASFVLVPDVDPDLAYVSTAVHVLPAGLLGLFVASFFAAYMSTVDTQLNWGASYLVHDFYRRFIARKRSERHYVAAARLATLLLAAAVIGVGLAGDASVTKNLRFVVLVTMGSGVALLARWFWWRATATAEIVALLGAAVAACVLRFGVEPRPYVEKILWTLAASGGAWLATVLLFPPRDPARLVAFYRRARPPGFWGPVAAHAPDVRRLPLAGWGGAAAGLLLVFGATLGIGELLLGSSYAATGYLVAAAAGAALLLRPRRAE